MKLPPRLILLFLLSNTLARCRAYDISQPAKPGPSSLPDDPKRRKSWLDLSKTKGGLQPGSSSANGRRQTFVIVSTVCSGAVGACVSSALVPHNLARQWLPVSAAGALLFVAAAVEGEWVGHVQQWLHGEQKHHHRRRPRVPEVSEVIDCDSSKQQPSGNTLPSDDGRRAAATAKAATETAAVTMVEIQPTGGINYPIQPVVPPKRAASSFGSEDKASAVVDKPATSSSGFTSSFSSSSSNAGSADSTSTAADSSTSSSTLNSEDKSNYWNAAAVDSSGKSDESVTRPKPNQSVQVGADYSSAPARTSSLVNKRKKSHRNLLMFWKKKKQEKDETDQKPPIPTWSHYAQQDNSRPYEEDYGDDSIGEGLGL